MRGNTKNGAEVSVLSIQEREISQQKTLMEKMTINTEQATAVIVAFLKEKVEEQKRNGIVLGLSGGVDSALAASLAIRAVGAGNVYTLHLFDRHSEKKALSNAREVAGMLNINFEVRNITLEMQAQGIYKPAMMRFSLFSRALNRFIVYTLTFISRRLLRESPYSLILRRGEREIKGRVGRAIFKTVYHAMADVLDSSFNARHIQRRRILESYALEKNLLLIGAANKSEAMVGWFVKDGVDDIPIEPILGLYKNQVRQLARFLGIPREIVDQTPSPDMWRGVGDELVIGFTYDKLDRVLYVLEHGLSPEVAFAEGITPTEYEEIKRINQLSAWKRENWHEFPVIKSNAEK